MGDNFALLIDLGVSILAHTPRNTYFSIKRMGIVCVVTASAGPDSDLECRVRISDTRSDLSDIGSGSG